MVQCWDVVREPVVVRTIPRHFRPRKDGMDKRLISLSKFLARHLRHAPEQIGLALEPGGWVLVEDLIQACRRAGRSISIDELRECVEMNDKQRFAFDEPGTRIRANQGHSITVELGLPERIPPHELYHGTVERFMDSILRDGLCNMNRHHVHLSMDVATARKVGSRRGPPVVLVVAASRMSRNGYVFYRSDNGVWLTDHVPPAYLSRL